MNMRCVWLFVVCLFLYLHLAEAQQSGKIPRVGFLGPASASALAQRLAAFREGLRELGYIEGKNIAIDYRYADSQADRITPLAAELLALKPGVIVTYQTPSAQAIKKLSLTALIQIHVF